jgi:drug/metabolite transporter (DMT)-like permease
MAAALAILASLGLAVGAVFARRGGLWVNPVLGARITIIVGIPIFAVLAFATGELSTAGSMTAMAVVWFALAGVVHFIIGRSLQYSAFKEMGASRATVVITLAPLISVIIAVPLFGEDVTAYLVVGAVLVMLGPILIAQGEARLQQAAVGAVSAIGLPSKEQLRRGVLLSLAAAVAWGITPIFVKAGLNENSLPVMGTFISYIASAFVVGAYLSRAGERRQFARMEVRGIWWFAGAGLAVAFAQFCRYVAFSEGDVTLVALMLQLVPLFVFILTVTFNRKLERVSPTVLVGGVLVVAGSTVIVIGS